MRKALVGVLVVATVLVIGGRWTVGAATTNLYANNASFGTPYIYVMSPSTFAVSDTLTNLSGSNGRGVVVVSGTVYYTSATTPNVFSYTLSSHTNNGSLFTVAGATALSTMAYDGTNFWIGDYSGTSKAYLYTPTGTLVKTVTLANCTGNCDGLEFFLQGGTTPRLISNRGDSVGPYDVYDTNGVLQTSVFITCPSSCTGIAYDGTNFFVSSGFSSIAKFSGTTGAAIGSPAPVTGAPSGNSPLMEDLSADYAQVLGPPPTTVPTLSTWGLIACALILSITGTKTVRTRLTGA